MINHKKPNLRAAVLFLGSVLAIFSHNAYAIVVPAQSTQGPTLLKPTVALIGNMQVYVLPEGKVAVDYKVTNTTKKGQILVDRLPKGVVLSARGGTCSVVSKNQPSFNLAPGNSCVLRLGVNGKKLENSYQPVKPRFCAGTQSETTCVILEFYITRTKEKPRQDPVPRPKPM